MTGAPLDMKNKTHTLNFIKYPGLIGIASGVPSYISGAEFPSSAPASLGEPGEVSAQIPSLATDSWARCLNVCTASNS